MQPVVLPIAGGFYESRSLPVSAQDCVNLYPYVVGDPGLNQEVLFGTPGLTEFATTGADSTEINRGATTMDGVAYFVNGETFYRVNSDASVDTIGSVYGTGRVSFANNGTKMLIIAQDSTSYPTARGYVFYSDEENGDWLEEVTDEGFWENGDPQIPIYIDGWFLCTTDEKKFIGSALNDPLSWNSLDVASAEADPDPISAPAKLNNTLYMIGSETIEGFSNQPSGSDFPFIRNGIFADKGTRSPYSVVTFNSAIFFIGGGRDESPAVWRYSGGGSPEKISTEAIDSILEGLTEAEVAAIFGMAYAQNGAYFVEYILPTRAIVYELTSGRWHERTSKIIVAESAVYTRHRINSVVLAYGKLLVGDFEDGRIGEMSLDTYSEYDAVIRRRVATKPFQNYMMGFSVPQLELTMESGQGAGVGEEEETDPQISLIRSLDGGKTWSYPRLRSMGLEGEYGKRQIWNKLGRASRFEVFAFETTAMVKVVLIQLTAKMVLHNK